MGSKALRKIFIIKHCSDFLFYLHKLEIVFDLFLILLLNLTYGGKNILKSLILSDVLSDVPSIYWCLTNRDSSK